MGFNAHLAIQFGIDLAKPPRMIAALACQAGGSAEATALPALIGRRNAAGSYSGSSRKNRRRAMTVLNTATRPLYSAAIKVTGKR